MSNKAIHDAVVSVIRLATQGLRASRRATHLDIGAGRGELISRLRALDLDSSACDFHPERFAVRDIPCVRVDIDRESLPYDEGRFDVVTCSEVVEHLENYRRALREAYRVTALGGLLVVTTPNVLNAASRVRYLTCGFANLFGPLPMRTDRRSSTGSHITPVPYFYIAHAILEAGFEEPRVTIDKVQRTSVFWLLVIAPFLLASWPWFLRTERERWRTLTSENLAHVRLHASLRVLTGRTIVVHACKPLASHV